MNRAVDVITRFVYALAGAFYLTTATVVLLVGTRLLPRWLKEQVFEIGHNIPDWMHLIQETGTLWMFVGILFVWFARHYERSLKFHWAATVMLGLDAWVHWFTPYGVFQNDRRALVNAIPFVVFLILGLLRRKYGSIQYEIVGDDI